MNPLARPRLPPRGGIGREMGKTWFREIAWRLLGAALGAAALLVVGHFYSLVGGT